MRVHLLPKGVTIAPLPAPRTGDVGRVLQGGLPPQPYRARNDWSAANPRTRRDGTSNALHAECFHSVALWDASARNRAGHVVGRWVAP